MVYFTMVKLNLTEVEKEVYKLLTKEFLTPKQVQIRRGVSKQAVYKIIRNLKRKGVITLGLKKVDFSLCTSKLPQEIKGQKIRLHGQEFNIKIIWSGEYYKKLIKKCNVIKIDKNTIRLFKDSIEIYSGHSFLEDNAQKATVKSFEYFDRILARLENDLKVILRKHRRQNIRLVNQHYAQINNELAKECEAKGHKIKVYTTEEGKLWFTIDNSFNLHEAETLDPKTAKQDMGNTVAPFFNDLRDNNLPLPSEVWKVLNETALQLNETAKKHNETAKYQKEIGAGLSVLVNLLNKTSNPNPTLNKNDNSKFNTELNNNKNKGVDYFG